MTYKDLLDYCESNPDIKPSKEEEQMKVDGEHTRDKDGNVICKCGKKDRFKIICHIDYTDFVTTTYECECECGNVISVTEKVERWF